MLTTDNTTPPESGLLASLLAEQSFLPSAPETIEQTGLSDTLIEALILKLLLTVGTASGRTVSERICIPFGVLEEQLHSLRSRQILCHTGSAALNDYRYSLTETGHNRAQSYMESCAYVGPAPVPLEDYLMSVEAQTIRAEAPRREALVKAFSKISIDTELFENLGPAINSGAGLFLYGEPGNGKSTLAKCITMCFGQHVWIPHAIIEDGQLIKFYDGVYHEATQQAKGGIIKSQNHDPRWIKVRRPTVIVGGELTLDSLEIRHDPRANVSEAPLQLKSNCGLLLIDDFGRQRIEPAELLNRWIVPLESHTDFLTLANGKKIQVPFDQLIIFSTNLDPEDLVDEAFLRRIPYKINIGDPCEQEFQTLFELYCKSFDCEYRADVVESLLAKHYRAEGRPRRRCHARDLLQQVRNLCMYNGWPLEMKLEYFDRVVGSYFTMLKGRDASR